VRAAINTGREAVRVANRRARAGAQRRGWARGWARTRRRAWSAGVHNDGWNVLIETRFLSDCCGVKAVSATLGRRQPRHLAPQAI
jgi:hypothetical protein